MAAIAAILLGSCTVRERSPYVERYSVYTYEKTVFDERSNIAEALEPLETLEPLKPLTADTPAVIREEVGCKPFQLPTMKPLPPLPIFGDRELQDHDLVVTRLVEHIESTRRVNHLNVKSVMAAYRSHMKTCK